MSKYILDQNGNPVLEPDLMKWARWFETADRSVAQTDIGDFHVSTVFLGLDHSFGSGRPVLYETMVFDRDTAETSGWGERCSTRDEAILMHERGVAWARSQMN